MKVDEVVEEKRKKLHFTLSLLIVKMKDRKFAMNFEKFLIEWNGDESFDESRYIIIIHWISNIHDARAWVGDGWSRGDLRRRKEERMERCVGAKA